MTKATNVFAQKHNVSRDKRGQVLGNNGAGFRSVEQMINEQPRFAAAARSHLLRCVIYQLLVASLTDGRLTHSLTNITLI